MRLKVKGRRKRAAGNSPSDRFLPTKRCRIIQSGDEESFKRFLIFSTMNSISSYTHAQIALINGVIIVSMRGALVILKVYSCHFHQIFKFVIWSLIILITLRERRFSVLIVFVQVFELWDGMNLWQYYTRFDIASLSCINI